MRCSRIATNRRSRREPELGLPNARRLGDGSARGSSRCVEGGLDQRRSAALREMRLARALRAAPEVVRGVSPLRERGRRHAWAPPGKDPAAPVVPSHVLRWPRTGRRSAARRVSDRAARAFKPRSAMAATRSARAASRMKAAENATPTARVCRAAPPDRRPAGLAYRALINGPAGMRASMQPCDCSVTAVHGAGGAGRRRNDDCAGSAVTAGNQSGPVHLFDGLKTPRDGVMTETCGDRGTAAADRCCRAKNPCRLASGTAHPFNGPAAPMRVHPEATGDSSAPRAVSRSRGDDHVVAGNQSGPVHPHRASKTATPTAATGNAVRAGRVLGPCPQAAGAVHLFSPFPVRVTIGRSSSPSLPAASTGPASFFA